MFKYKFNLFLICSISFLFIIFFFVDDNLLNYFKDNIDNRLVIEEIDTSYKEVVKIDNNSSNVTFISNNKWIFPVSGNYTITTYFGYGHNAIDIYSYNGYGSSILAANSGTVISANGGCYRGDIYCNGRGGNYIIIRHNNNYYSVYMHLATINVSVGENVSFGQVIGTMGNTGNVIPVPTASNPYGGTHLHFAIYIGEPYKGGYAINPLNMY